MAMGKYLNYLGLFGGSLDAFTSLEIIPLTVYSVELKMVMTG